MPSSVMLDASNPPELLTCTAAYLLILPIHWILLRALTLEMAWLSLRLRTAPRPISQVRASPIPLALVLDGAELLDHAGRGTGPAVVHNAARNVVESNTHLTLH